MEMMDCYTVQTEAVKHRCSPLSAHTSALSENVSVTPANWRESTVSLDFLTNRAPSSRNCSQNRHFLFQFSEVPFLAFDISLRSLFRPVRFIDRFFVLANFLCEVGNYLLFSSICCWRLTFCFFCLNISRV